MYLFLGKDIDYWLALQEMLDTTGIPEDLLEEVIKLRGKVSFYESRIKELHKAIEE